jgi:hypothetical protein
MGGVGNPTQGTSRLADRSYYRIDLGRAQAKFLSARSFYYETTEAAWDTLVRGDDLGVEQTNLLRLSATNAAHACAEVVDKAYKLAGMSAIFSGNRLQLLLRDAIVVTQHATLSEATHDTRSWTTGRFRRWPRTMSDRTATRTTATMSTAVRRGQGLQDRRARTAHRLKGTLYIE